MTALSGPEKRGMNKLEETRVTPPVEFYAEVVKIDQEAIDLRHRISKLPLRISGYTARKKLSELEEEYIALHEDLTQARRAVLTGEPYLFDRVEQGFADHQNSFVDGTEEYLSQINLTYSELERTSALLTAKQSEAVGRMGVVVSTGAVAVSTLAVITSVLVN